MDISKLQCEQNIMILHNLQLEGFMNLSVQENGIMFSFGADDKNVYLIKSDEKVLFEPSIFQNAPLVINIVKELQTKDVVRL